jgi:hypothetical protein
MPQRTSFPQCESLGCLGFIPHDPRTIRERPDINQPMARQVIAQTVITKATRRVIIKVDMVTPYYWRRRYTQMHSKAGRGAARKSPGLPCRKRLVLLIQGRLRYGNPGFLAHSAGQLLNAFVYSKIPKSCATGIKNLDTISQNLNKNRASGTMRRLISME